MLTKILNFYVNIYIGEDMLNNRKRVESKRLWYLVWHFVCLLIILSGFFEIFFIAIAKILGVVK